MRHAEDPIVEATELSGAEAALAALIELSAADLERSLDEDDVVTREFVVPRLRYADFDPSVIEALMALEADNDDVVLDEPIIEAGVITFNDLRVMERLLEPYVDFSTLASVV